MQGPGLCEVSHVALPWAHGPPHTSQALSFQGWGEAYIGDLNEIVLNRGRFAASGISLIVNKQQVE